MIKCPNCGTENEDAANFCESCATKLPHEKECPNCHAKVKLTAKFCTECAYNFATASNTNTAATGFSVGDKNVIAGDVIGKQETFQINGVTTIVKNEDETKKMVQCHICGHNIAIINSIECPICHEITCDKCYDLSRNICNSCAEKKRKANEDVYLQALKKAYEDKMITPMERQALNKLKSELDIPDSRVAELENQIKKESFSVGTTSQLSFFEKKTLENALNLLYDAGNAPQVYELLKPIFKHNPQNKEVLTVFLDAALKVNPDEVLQIIQQNQTDEIEIYLVCVDYYLMKHDLHAADECLNNALMLWPENLLLNCRKILCLKAMYDEIQERTLLHQAEEILLTVGTPQNKLEESWLAKAQFCIYQAMGKEVPQTTVEFCKEKNLFFFILNSGCDAFFQKALTLENVESELEKKEYFRLLQNAANDGSPRSLKKLGLCFYQGRGVKKDTAQAVKLYIQAAEQGDTEAQNQLGFWYLAGDGVEQSFWDAFQWFQKAEKLGDETAQKTLNAVLEDGKKIKEKADAEKLLKDGFAQMQADMKQGIEFDGLILKSYPDSNVSNEYEVPYGITEIDNRAFASTDIKLIKIPPTVKKICEDAFRYCQKLHFVSLSEGLEYIGESAFLSCESLTEIIMPQSVKKIADYAFNECKNLQKIVLNKGLESIGKSVFWDCENLEEITIPGSIKTIEEHTFLDCKKLRKVILNEGVESIGDMAFVHCENLTEIIFPKSIVEIMFTAFLECNKLKRAVLPSDFNPAKAKRAFPDTCKIIFSDKEIEENKNSLDPCDITADRNKEHMAEDTAKTGYTDNNESEQDYVLEATQFDFKGKQYLIPDVKSVRQILCNFAENVTSNDTETCWCKNGVKDNCNEDCSLCILCSNKGNAHEKIDAFIAFCKLLNRDFEYFKVESYFHPSLKKARGKIANENRG